MAKRTKVPRASLACTILDDTEYVALMLTKHGREAFALYTTLLCAAKSQANEGVFDQQPAVIAALIRWPLAAYQNALATLQHYTNWTGLDPTTKGLAIRSYAKWNAWGGNRDGAGRKPSANQDGIKLQSKPATPASASVSGTKTTTTLSDKSDGEREPNANSKAEVRFAKFWSFFPRKIGKGKAWAAFRKLKAEDQDQAIDQAEAYAQAFALAPDQRKQFFKHPTTWINARSWEDDHAEWALIIEGK